MAGRTRRSLERNPRTPENREKILAAFRDGDSVNGAATRAGISRVTLWRWRQEDEAFALACADAIEAGTDELEEVARRRAVEGSDTLLIFLLKARRPDKYRDTVKVDQTTTIRDERLRRVAESDPDLVERIARVMAQEKQPA